MNDVDSYRYSGFARSPSESTGSLKIHLRVAVLLVCAWFIGCQDPPAAADPSAGVESESAEGAAVVATQPAIEARPPVDGCIKGGTTRAEVMALLGEPDSISFGAWLYGRSEVTFGYGVVVAYADLDDNLELC